MSLIESWRKIAQLNLSATSPLDNNNARGFGIALASAAENLEVACTPRAPRSEWFGTGPNQWDAWWVSTSTKGASPNVIHVKSVEFDELVTIWNIVPLRTIIACVPVAREGFPAPVGWHVVGG